MPRATRKPGPLRKSSVTSGHSSPAVISDQSVTPSVTHPDDGAVRDALPTPPVTTAPDRPESVSDESVTPSQPERQDGGGSGQEVVTEPDRNEPAKHDAPPGESSPSGQGVATKGVLAALLEELEAAPVEQVDTLRRALLLPPTVKGPERRRVPKRTYAWYLPEELGEAVKRKAKAEGVPPSEIAERMLRQARALGWV